MESFTHILKQLNARSYLCLKDVRNCILFIQLFSSLGGISASIFSKSPLEEVSASPPVVGKTTPPSIITSAFQVATSFLQGTTSSSQTTSSSSQGTTSSLQTITSSSQTTPSSQAAPSSSQATSSSSLATSSSQVTTSASATALSATQATTSSSRETTSSVPKTTRTLSKEKDFPRLLKSCSSGPAEIFATEGIIYLTHDGDYPVTLKQCVWRVIVPEGHFLELEYELIQENCFEHLMNVEIKDPFRTIGSYVCRDADTLYKLSLASANNVTIVLFSDNYILGFEKLLHNVTLFKIHFRMTDIDGRSQLAVEFTSKTAGYITSAGYVDGGRKPSFLPPSTYPPGIDASYDLIVPAENVVMVSPARLDLFYAQQDTFFSRSDSIEILEQRGESYVSVETITSKSPLSAYVFPSRLRFRFTVSVFSEGGTGFKLLFSFHPVSEAPVKMSSGLFDCSVPHFASFQQHLTCNLQLECEGGRDEDNCPFSSPQCNGSVALHNKCYRYVESASVLSWKEADGQCKAMGGQLAVMSSRQEQDAVRAIFTHARKWAPAHVGLQRVDLTVMPELYRKMWMWKDRTVAYSAHISYRKLVENFENACGVFTPSLPHIFLARLCSELHPTLLVKHFICEISATQEDATPTRAAVDFPVLKNSDRSERLSALNLKMVTCPDGHVTHGFLACDAAADCGAGERRTTCPVTRTYYSTDSEPDAVSDDLTKDTQPDTVSDDLTKEAVLCEVIRGGGRPCVTVAMFVCDDDRATIPYTLVCDYKRDCQDGSDEEFCDHGNGCPEFTCRTGQCLEYNRRCDDVSQCWDGRDEASCPGMSSKDFFLTLGDTVFSGRSSTIVRRLPAPSVVQFDGRGNFSQTVLAPSQPCPDTHFACVSDPSHCLPVYLRCNGVFDCRGREDEMDCDRYTCPGFYRCRGSRVCVHAEHLCDGWSQCPQRDDEVHCAMACPQQCHCQALAFVCPQPFYATTFPHLRYLDATGSGMTLKDVSSNRYLVWLSLASCNLSVLALPALANLQHLDVSDNRLTSVNVELLLNVARLRVLRLAGNPLLALSGPLSLNAKHQALIALDLSRTALRHFDSQVLAGFTQIRNFNISYSTLSEVGAGGFRALPALTELDVRGSPLDDFPRDVFRGLSELKTIFSDNYKLCCRDTLPDTFDARFCLAPQDEISSCEDLLRSNVYRACLWLFAALALLGNVGCLLFRFLSSERKSKLGFNVFVTNLSLADCLMGVYLVIVGVADELYRGQYVWQEKAWRRSSACQTAGFLSLLSSEMSAFIICLITLDRFIVLRFPFSTFRFRRMSAALACGMAWLLGLLLAAVPLLPMTSDWQFYGQTGICIPLPITRKSFRGQHYAFAVIIVLNFVLFLLIAAGQAFIYWSVKSNSMTATDSSKKSQDLTIARRLITVAVSDFLCWFPIGLLGIMASSGTPIPSEVNVGMAIFVLPLNSALNPFLYTFNVLMEKHRKAEEARLMKQLEARILSQRTETSKTN